MYMNQGMSEKDALKAAAKDRGVSKRDLYNEYKRYFKKSKTWNCSST